MGSCVVKVVAVWPKA